MKIAIIGGSGLDDPQLLEDYEERKVDTSYGDVFVTCGKISGVEVFILARHGKNHEIPPGKVNYRANIYALKKLGCEVILATSAVGSLREEIEPGSLVFPEQFMDFTKLRQRSFYESEVKHTPMAEPFDKEVRKELCECCDELNFSYNKDVTIVTIEGPCFSTKAESFMYKQLGGDIVNMSTCPEVILANELGMRYQTIAMTTDYDCWKEDEESVTWEIIQRRTKENSEKVKKLIVSVVPKIANKNEEFIKSKIRTIPNFPKQGIMFRDITTLLKDTEGMNRIVEIFCERYKNEDIDIIVGIEPRGFIIGSVLANRLGKGFVPIRKPGKLPSEVERQEYELEYGKEGDGLEQSSESAAVEIHKDSIKPGQRVLLIDDLLATAGTAKASCELIRRLGGQVLECGFIVELPDLKGREKLENKGEKVFSMVRFEGE